MRIVVFGAGGVGGYFGGRLALAGEDVSFIARGRHLEALCTQGLRVESIKGDFMVQRVSATDDPSQIGVVDIILLAVKAWQVPQAGNSMLPMMGANTAVVPLCNGVDAPAEITATLGEDHALGGLCRISAMITAPGHIRHPGIEPYIAFGELNNQPSRRTEALLRVFENAGVKAEIPEDIRAAMWEKFIFIASISGVGAVTRVPVGVMRSIPETRQMLESAIEEIWQIARAYGIGLSKDIAERTMNFIDTMAPNVTASMQRDIMEGRPSELASQNGAVVRLGSKAGIATPTHKFIYESLLPQELEARKELGF